MKQSFLRATFLAAVLIFAASCNDDDDDGDSGPTQPAFTFTADRFNTTDGSTSEWSADFISAVEALDGSLEMTMANNSDTLYFRFPSAAVGQTQVNNNSFFYRDDNRFVAFSSGGDEFGITDTTGVVNFTIESNDTTANLLSGTFLVDFFNLDDGVDRFLLQNGVFTDVSYTTETLDFGGFGDGTISYSVDGQGFSFDDAVGASEDGVLDLSAFTFPAFAPGVNLTMNADIETGTYQIETEDDAISGSVTLNDLFDSYSSTDGTLTISSHDMTNRNIVGTFSFTAESFSTPTETVSVTNGMFNVNY